MKKKVLYGVFMALFAFAAIGTLQSCKDDVSDLRNQTNYDVSTLKDLLQNAAQDLKDLEGRVSTNEADIRVIKADYAKLSWCLKILGLQNENEELPAAIKDKGGVVPALNGALADIKTNTDDIKAIKDFLGPLDPDDPASIFGRLKALEAADQALMDGFGVTNNADLTAKIQKLLKDIYDDPDGALANIKALQEDVANLAKTFDEYLKANVSGILIQGTDNPLFGNFSLPIGIKSNMLFGWYGKNERVQTIEFPSSEGGFDAEGNYIPGAILRALNPQGAIEIESGDYYGNGEGGVTLGKVYLTLNPTNVNLDGTKLSLENSKGESLPYTLNVQKSNDLLAFGYTSRAEEEAKRAGNGFYESEVVMPATAEAIDRTAIKIEEGLKVAAKDALQDKSKRNAANLLKAIYDQMSGKLDAFAARYDWTYTDLEGNSVPSAVLSQYDLAVATAHPLGFNFLSDKSTSHKLPTFGSVDNFLNRLKNKINSKFNFAEKNITVEGKPVKMSEIVITSEQRTNSTTRLPETWVIATVKDLTWNGVPVYEWGTTNNVKAETKTPSEIVELTNEAICKAIAQTIAGSQSPSEELQAKANVAISVTLLEMQNQIAQVVDEITGRAENIVKNAFNKVQKHSDRVQQLFDLYNKVANKINEVLVNPNAYLQVAAFYTTSTNVDILSADPNQPTPFDISTGDGICLYLSSYTGELIAPAYKKYAAITAINDKTDKIADVNGGDLNKVLDGTQLRVNVPTDKLVKGNKYEITYQAVDFRGYTSTRKFYIKVI